MSEKNFGYTMLLLTYPRFICQVLCESDRFPSVCSEDSLAVKDNSSKSVFCLFGGQVAAPCLLHGSFEGLDVSGCLLAEMIGLGLRPFAFVCPFPPGDVVHCGVQEDFRVIGKQGELGPFVVRDVL